MAELLLDPPRSVRHTPWAAARRAAYEGGGDAGRSHGEIESVPLVSAVGRTLAQPAACLAALPGFAASAMDGWAVRGSGPWRIGPEVLAGAGVPAQPLLPGQARPIATGAPVPPETHAVLRREDGQVGSDGLLRSDRGTAPRPGEHLRRAGEEAQAGESLIADGVVLTPARVALLAAAGHDAVAVHAQPAVAVVVLGDELAARGIPAAGKVRDVFGPSLPGWLAALGAGAVTIRHAGDELSVTTRALSEARHSAPLVVTTGGSARGPADFSRGALGALGARPIFDGVAIRPGHPVMLHRMPDAGLVLSLPGNPLAGMVCVALFAAAILDGMLGRPLAETMHERAATALPNPTAGTRLTPCVRQDGLHPTAWQGSAMLRGLAAADVLAIVPPGGVPAGDRIEALPLR